MKEEVACARPFGRLRVEALGDEVALLFVFQGVDGACDVLVGYDQPRFAVALDLEGSHLEGADAEREDVDGWRQSGCANNSITFEMSLFFSNK